ncbi:MAG: FHA domain-containing protein [Eubacteriales bacterium]|nr:FHA domain-containing protein [Eubacteriales bacterium]
MKKISLRVRSFEQERFLTYNIDNDSGLDEEVLDFIEEEEPKGIVPVIYEEGDEYDTFSYNITDKIHLSDLSLQEINAEMALNIIHSLLLALIDMSEYRIPLSYLVLNRNYIYVDSDYNIEFICIPLEDMQENMDINVFLRGFLANIRYDLSEDCQYVAKLLTYVNNTAMFNMRNMVTLIEELMDDMNVEIKVDDSNEIYVDYQEVEEEEAATTEETVEEDSVADMDISADFETPKATEDVFTMEESEEVFEEPQEEVSDSIEEADATDDVAEKESESEEEQQPEETVTDEEKTAKKTTFKTKEAAGVTGVVLEDDFDQFLAQKEHENHIAQFEESGIKIKKSVKVNRADVMKSAHDEEKPVEEDIEEKEEVTAVEEEVEVDTSILTQSPEMTGILNDPLAPKANPYLVRTNTEERIMITKQNFMIGKATMGVDYTIRGNGAISRKHAVIICKDGIYYIKDNKSTNHTYVNNKQVGDGQNELLPHDCKIVLGDEEFTFKLR